MDITQLKNFLKNNIKYIVIAIVLLTSLIGFSFTLKNMDKKIAVKLINEDLLTRSIDEENYIINHTVVFDDDKLKNNIEELFRVNNLNIGFSVIVKDNKVSITIGKEKINYEITPNNAN